MDFDERLRELLIEYRAAHLLWKRLPPGDEKTEAKRRRGQLHSELLAAIELLERRTKQGRST